MNFGAEGPFELRRYGLKSLINNDTISFLRAALEKFDLGLSEACGCYVFAVRAGRGFTPYYVGRAEKRSILNESLNPSNIIKYNNVISNIKGTPTMFVLPMLTPQGRYRKLATGELGSLRFLEKWLIAQCIEKNPDLVNNKETKFLRSIHVTGIFNATQGEAHAGSTALRKAIWR
ncbi:hypothetical protein [Roseiarcus fermentans]|nr:hypothetical protein [Roseiarcus fermentans]